MRWDLKVYRVADEEVSAGPGDDDELCLLFALSPERLARRDANAFEPLHIHDRHAVAAELIVLLTGHDAVEGGRFGEEPRRFCPGLEQRDVPFDVEAIRRIPAVEP